MMSWQGFPHNPRQADGYLPSSIPVKVALRIWRNRRVGFMEDKLGLVSQRPAVVLAGDEAHAPHMVTFEQPDGGCLSLNYRDLRSVRYDPAGLVHLRFTAYNVVLHGRNLISVWRALRSRRVKLLRARGTEATTGHEPHIDSIAITSASRWD
jgi:hypothetical protein